MATPQSVGGVEMEASLDTSKFDKGVDSIEGKLKKLDPSMQKTERGMNQVEQSTNKAGKSAETSSLSFGKLVKAFGLADVATRAFYAGLRLVQRGLDQLMVGPIREAIKFESIMAKVGTTLRGSTKQDIDALGDSILAMTRKFPKSKEELGTGLYTILQSGVEDAASAMKILEAATKAAVGGNTEVGTSAKVLTQIMNAYNLTAEETVALLDSIFVGAQKGSAEFADLATSLGTTLGSASQLRVGIPEIVAAVETMANAGFSADEATTSINAFFTSVIQASDGSTEAAKTARALGIEYNSAALKSKGLQKFIEDITNKAGNNEIALQSLTGNVRAFRAVALIAGKGNEFFNDTLKEMEESTGALDEAFNRMAGTAENKLILAWNKWNAAVTEAGRKNAPELHEALDDLNDTLDNQSERITDAATSLSSTLIGGMQAVIEFAPELIAVLDAIASAAGAVVNAIGSVIRAGNRTVDRALLKEGSITQEQFDLNELTRTGQKTPAEIELERTISSYNMRFGTRKPVTAAEERRMALAGESPMSPSGGGGSGKTREQMARDIEKAEQDLIKSYGDEAKANLDNLKIRRKELEIRRDLGIATSKELRDLERINERVEFQEDKVDDATKAWEKQKGVVEKLKDEIKDINDDIAATSKELNDRLADIDQRAKERKTDRIAELVRERDEIRNAATGSGGLTGDMSRRLGEIEGELSGVDPSLLVAGTEDANLTELQKIDKDAELEKVQARKEADEELLESRTKLTDKTKELESAEIDLKRASDDVVKAVETLTASTDANFTATEARTKMHVDRMVSELSRLRAAYSSAYGGGGAEQAATELRGVAGMPFADGGTVGGRGHDRSDNIPALLSPGERVITAAKNRMYAPVLDAIHRGTFPIRQYADGGVVNHNERSATYNIHNHGRAAEVFADPRVAKWYSRTAL